MLNGLGAHGTLPNRRNRPVVGFVVALVGEQRPDDAGVLVGQGDGGNVSVASSDQAREPAVGLISSVRKVSQHRASAMDKQRAQVSVAVLAYAQQPGLAARGVLARHQPYPGGYLPPVAEVLRIPDAGDQGARGERADAPDALQSAAILVVPVPGDDLALELLDLLVEFPKLRKQSAQQRAHQPRQRVVGVLQDVGNLGSEPCHALRHDDAELAKQPADLVALRRSGLDPARARSVQRQHCLLFGALHWHEAHVGPCHRLANRLRVVAVVLVRLDIRLDEARGHESNLMAAFDEFARPVVRPPAGLHPDQAGRHVDEELQHLVAFELLAQDRLAPRIDPMDLVG